MTDKKTIVVSVILFLLIGLLFIKLWKTSSGAVKTDIPLVNDAWYDALKAIEMDSENNPGQLWEKAIITSWWDFGHHFKYLSNRAVTFDGGTQVTPQAHWVGKLFLSAEEEVSVRILRMLDCGGNKAFDSLTTSADTPFIINVLNQWFKKELNVNDFAPFTITYLNCNPPSAYVIASEDMIGKAGVWAHFGSWDFNRADMWINVKKMPKDQGISYILSHSYAKTYNDSEQLWMQLQTMTESDANNWIAPWPGYAGVNDCKKDTCMTDFNMTGVPQDPVDLVARGRMSSYECIRCSNGVEIVDDEVTYNGLHPQSFIYLHDGKLIEKKYNNSGLGYSIILTPDNKIITATPDLASSLFTKLFFMNATGLKHFELLTKTQGIDGFKIFVYKVKWQ